MFKKAKLSFKRFLETIAQQNQKSFGDKRMDCCDVNKDNKTIPKHK